MDSRSTDKQEIAACDQHVQQVTTVLSLKITVYLFI